MDYIYFFSFSLALFFIFQYQLPNLRRGRPSGYPPPNTTGQGTSSLIEPDKDPQLGE